MDNQTITLCRDRNQAFEIGQYAIDMLSGRYPNTWQSADHSMVYIIAVLLRKLHEARAQGWDGQQGWQRLTLMPAKYADDVVPVPDVDSLHERFYDSMQKKTDEI